MKQLRYIGLALYSLFFMTACQDFLDITPEGQVKQSELLSTTSGIEDALYGVYSQLRLEALYGQEMSFSALDIMAQYLDCYGNLAITALSAYNYTYSDIEDLFEEMWTQMYKNISNVNAVITCDLLQEEHGYPYDIYLGEALGLRAFMHFDLLRLFTEQYTLNEEASGIPYATEFSLNTPDFQTEKECYRLIINDLRRAEELLENEDDYVDETYFMTSRQIHFNRYAAQATLARVYLTIGDKDSAYYYANKVIEESGYTLSEKTEVIGDLAGVLSAKETIFGVYYGQFYSLVYPKLQQTISFSSLNPREDIMDFYNNTGEGLDYRTTAYFTATSSGSSASYRLSKLTDVYELQGISSSRPSDLIQGINLIRIPEMYYIAAECLLDTDYDRALELFDEVLSHRGLEPVETWSSSPVLTQDVINNERYKEFIGEGQTFFNMKRQNLSISGVDGSTTYSPSNSIYVVPIPDIEYDNRY